MSTHPVVFRLDVDFSIRLVLDGGFSVHLLVLTDKTGRFAVKRPSLRLRPFPFRFSEVLGGWPEDCHLAVAAHGRHRESPFVDLIEKVGA